MTTYRTILLSVLALIVFAVVMRLLPHAPNATPITALAFVGSIYFGWRWAFALPLAALAISDFVIGGYDFRVMASVYVSVALVALLSVFAKRYERVSERAALLVCASILFFLVTNGAVWAFSPWYEKSAGGLLYAYELGLPFFRNMLVGDVIYTALLCGACELVRSTFYARAYLGLRIFLKRVRWGDAAHIHRIQ